MQKARRAGICQVVRFSAGISYSRHIDSTEIMFCGSLCPEAKRRGCVVYVGPGAKITEKGLAPSPKRVS